MADNNRNEQQDLEQARQPQEEQEPKKTPGRGGTFLRRLGTLLVTLLIVLGILAVSMMGDGNILDRVRRWINYGAAAAEDAYLFAADHINQYGQVGEYLVVLTQNYIQFLEDSGTAYQVVEELALSQPVLDTGGGLAVAYDAGGQKLFLVSPEGTQLSLSLSEGDGYISARLNSSGWLAVCAEKSGYKGAVTVYNGEQELIYEVDLSSQFVVDAVVTEDCRFARLMTYGEENGAFCTNLVWYDLSAEEPVASVSLPNHVGFDMGKIGECYGSISSQAVAFVGKDGSTSGGYVFGGQYLQDYAFGDDFIALFLTRYQSGSVGTVLTLDSQGNVFGVLDVSDEILDIDAAGDHLAVLQSNTLVLYTSDLTEYSRLSDTSYASHVLMAEDGSALVIGGSSAWRYLP